ncbi:signal recognition particle-docking protein FtsY [Snodgrassella gandavensis]|uniref:signal recognition particle-docking protein FtsY n=1 Tax=Snodgrassella gandavensis TaxID=2946698 RepID=UPI001EF73A6A|nr:signal recognition particle-docking protein FtsY [Snodgrassella gandavensis]
MFRFFKRKKNTEPAVEQPASTPSQPENVQQLQEVIVESAPAETTVKTEAETIHHTTAEPAPADEAPAQPAAEIAEEIIVPTVVDEPAAIATTTEPVPAQTPASENAMVIPVAPAEPSSEADKPAKLGWAARLKQGLSKSRNHMAKSLASVFGGGKIDEDLYEELETVLLTSDMGIEATEKLLAQVRQRVTLKGLKNGNELRSALKEALYELLLPLQQPLILPTDKKPFVIMMAGVNGAGKTTSIGKLAKYFQSQGKSVLLAAGDTFRAAAREQLQQWGERNNVTVIAQASGDSAAVCFDALEAAKARGIDVVLADTAGRLPTQLHLMEEIKKVKRVLQKSLPEAPHEVMLVLDANVGQNAINQVVAFDDALGLTGLIVSKLDGTAKGGILAALAAKRPIPVRFIGVGESIDDLRPFDARAFVDALIEDEE